MIRCRKRKFSKIDAKIALANMQAKDKGAKRIYYHDQCKAWHITSQVKRASTAKAKRNTTVVAEKKNE